MSAIMSALLTYFGLVVTPNDAMSQPHCAEFAQGARLSGRRTALS
jgi:hypothetical protein